MPGAVAFPALIEKRAEEVEEEAEEALQMAAISENTCAEAEARAEGASEFSREVLERLEARTVPEPESDKERQEAPEEEQEETESR